ncbi:RNA polymerase sigma factor [Magnetospirillum sulfuroxidans]|uniref:Sigma-70 family RNA polymerase sigma factor n=1 Tax=Magnetospirillum sulfuroxidans TaxID=611300 RepID=A0ABS5IBJ1_9PROT|nr:sigma-70 family RNA polymerase sigma factor [Magnetospirillum sulfuroxidans]MBR9971796.1 sigma-70 family RNA polymerase sigma factor [Magnetospirillum sulfuroxidans]
MPPDHNGGRQRLTATITRERDKITRLVRARLGRFSELDAEDVVSDAVLRLLERADLLAEVENLTAYLFRAVGNSLTDLLRRHRRTEELSPDQEDRAPGPDQNAQHQQWRDLLEAALAQLSLAEREVWVAVEVEGYTFRELAEQWGQPIGTLLSRKNRAEKTLKRLLADPNQEGKTP